MRAKRESWVPGVTSRDHGNWGWKLLPVTAPCFILWRKLRKLFDAEMSSFPTTGRSTNSIAWNRWLLLNKWMLQLKLRWWGYKLVGRCKLSCYENESCDEHAVYFWRWLKWLAMFITFLLSSNDLYLHTRMFCRKYSLNILKNTRPSSMTWWYRVL